MSTRSAGLGALLCALTLHQTAHAQRDADYASSGDAWNSVSALMRIAERHSSARVEAPRRLDIGTLRSNDALLILHPRSRVPSSEISAFLRAGGRVALADDYGEGGALLRTFQIGRGEPSRRQALQLRGNAELLVARPRGSHRLAQGVGALVTNHPAFVSHRQLSPIFELGPGEALVLAGAVGSGRFVVLADPSVLIDNMVALRGNRVFAENLIDYLMDGRGGRLFVIGPDAVVVGRFGEPGADRPLHDLRSSLTSLAALDLPPVAVRIASLALAAIAAILALGTLPRRSPYRAERMFARAPAQGGFVGRVGFFARRGTNLLQPLMVYKFELEAEILRKLSLSGRTLLRDVLGAMRERGINEEDVEAMRALLMTLDQLRDLQDRPPTAPSIGPRRFAQFIASGERLLGVIDRGTGS